MTPEDLSLVDTKDLVEALFVRFDAAVFAATARVGPERAQHGFYMTGDPCACDGLANWLGRKARKQIDDGVPSSDLGDRGPDRP